MYTSAITKAKISKPDPIQNFLHDDLMNHTPVFLQNLIIKLSTNNTLKVSLSIQPEDIHIINSDDTKQKQKKRTLR